MLRLPSTRPLRPGMHPALTRRPLPPPSRLRAFHATARREAIPLIPVAGLAIFKGASLLTVATVFSRILISFFPVGTLAAFKMIRADKWMDSEVVRPSVGPPAEDFYRMWCEGEQAVRVPVEETDRLIDVEPGHLGGLTLADGRVAYPVPMPPRSRHHGFKSRTEPHYTPQALMEHSKGNRKHVAWWIRRGYFIIPPLPPSAEPYYKSLPQKDREEVDSLRRYWIGLKFFKDCFVAGRILLALVFGLPFLLICTAYIAGLERVPLTGRWRLILLTPEEEDAISTSLGGGNWYRSVVNLLTTAEHPAPPIVPTNDWRWAWVQSILTRLEEAALSECRYTPNTSLAPSGPDSLPIPPPTYHPFTPRPRASSVLHSVLPGGDPSTGREHLEIGPPYNIMLMQKDEENAFSYGFGGKRAGGIVVYTGLLDHILYSHDPSPASAQPSRTGLLGGLFGSRSPPPTKPTPEQDLHLACVLAHEMGHLLLSHHLETLSQQQVLWPSVLGLSMDLIRAFIWPFTFFLGPTVNDALASVGRTSTEELSQKYGEIGFQWKHEYEADLAGLRLLARAGFNPHSALSHFSSSVASLHEIQPIDKADDGLTGAVFKLWSRATHPSAGDRSEAIRKEIERWEQERTGGK
ncbi:hypothetical protein L202_02759 [Cryptococcus amylolentus CBS 6039]|uniref:Peptidase M48 domain-containing protein n=2 Tax=Cryptococcus amylolentus TaxID=104669 RepID=A0A1E3HW59_9TREE|nr:hypothetical protein L202_02759 [Cryptococcus amylolentus CBS 6039]ODN80558.1 hypothetical protein L202_02759 [Cryptococcus amylolentus CBS 6039]ODO09137.1 hypothetical protein I350_02737 [Cryptococcus amylolentus CBS 6273]